MIVTPTGLPEVLLIEPRVFADERGFFTETFQEDRYREHGMPGPWIQDNLAGSKCGVLRGLHYQWPNPQGKLISVISGEILDVAVDIRSGSPTFGQWVGERLSGENRRQLWVPAGFAHGYLVRSTQALVAYKVTAPYHPENDRGVRWDDPQIGIEWGLTEVILSAKDALLPCLGSGIAHP